jgi:AcrR family transcriptional regulator
MTATSVNTPTAGRHPTAQRVLDAAIAVIEDGGEEAVQVEPLVRDLGLTVTAIYRWFGSRQGLVQAAQQERFVRLSNMGLEPWGEALIRATGPEQVGRLIDTLLERSLDAENCHMRRRRANALGSAFGRPELMVEMGSLIHDQVDRLGRYLERAHAAGVIHLCEDPRSVSLWLPMVVLGRVCFELDPAPPSVTAWNDLCRQALYLALLDTTPTTPMARLSAPPVTTWSEPDLPHIPDHPTPQLLVSLAIEMIDEYGEDGVKVEPLSRSAGLNVTTIYHWFGNRQGLIDVAQAVRFRRRGLDRLILLEQAVRRVTNREEARALLDSTQLGHMDDDTVSGQIQRLNALGAAYARPTLASAIGTLHHRDRRHLAGILRQLQVPGYLRAELDLEAFSSWIIGVLLGQALMSFDERPDVIAGVRALQRRVSHQLLFGQDPPGV